MDDVAASIDWQSVLQHSVHASLLVTRLALVAVAQAETGSRAEEPKVPTLPVISTIDIQ